MNMGDCPYEDCDGLICEPVPDHTPAYALFACETCGRDVWYKFSRVDPESWTREEFERLHTIDEATRQIHPKALGAL